MAGTTLEARWCEVHEADPDRIPDFDKVPEAKREAVRQAWVERQMHRAPTRWKMWGPQVQWYNSLGYMNV